MGLEDDWFSFLQLNAQFYVIAKSGSAMEFLQSISEGKKTVSELKKLFPEIGDEEMQVLLGSLVSAKVASRENFGSNAAYSITADGKVLLREYRKIKKFYST